MILILSNSSDVSTHKIINYLSYAKIEYCAISNDECVEVISVELSNFVVIFNDKIIDSNKISGFLCRKGAINIKHNIIDVDSSNNFINYLRNFCKYEINEIISYVNILLEEKRKVGSILKSRLNKLFVLKQALSCNLLVPSSIIVTDANKMRSYFGKDEVLTKSLSIFFSYLNNDLAVNAYSTIPDKPISHDSFFPSYLQEYIEKDYEIRSFFLIDKFYSMAIFSQNNMDTEIDYRKQSAIKNRNVPYSLPNHIEEKLISLMKNLELNTASIDIIKSKSGDFIFLEVNPDGIFDNVSYHCNYYLEKIIADYLSKTTL